MKTHSLILVSVALTASTALPAQTTPATPATADETVTLPAFSVSSERGNGYRATDSMSAARIRTPIIDTPATVNVITSDFLKDIGAASLFDATQYISGIGNGRLAGASGILDRQTIRGYENDGRTIDNFNSSFQANLDPLLYERVEIVKGPNAILAPTGTPGGSVNVITKSPQFTQANTVQAEIGRYFSDKLSVDSTGPVPGMTNAAYRIIAGFQDSAPNVKPGSIRQWSVNPQFKYKFSNRSQLTLKFNYAQWGTYGGAANPGVTLNLSDSLADGATATPDSIAAGFKYGSTNGAVPSWAVRTDRVERAMAEFTHALTDNINMRIAAMRHFDHFWTDSYQLNPAGTSKAARYNPYTGVYTPTFTWAKNAAGTYVPTFAAQYDPTSIPLSASYQHTWRNDAQIQNDFAGKFNVSGVSVQSLVGASYQRSANHDKNWNAVAGQLPNLNLYAPVFTPAHPVNYTVSSMTDSVNTKEQLYAFTRLGFFSDRLFVNGGISRLWLNAPTTNMITGVRAPLYGTVNTPLYGALYKVTKNASVYFNHSTNANAVAFNGTALFQQGKQDEFGAKTEFFDQRLSITASHFQIKQNNIVTPNPSYQLDTVNNPQFLKADLANHGYEFDVVGGITKELSLIGSFTDMKLRDAFGRRRRNIPDTTLNGMLKYDVREGAAKNLSVFAGFTHVGKQAGEDPVGSSTVLGVVTQTSFYIQSRTIYNAGASYILGRTRLNLNVDNIFDKKALWQGSDRFSVGAYPGVNYRLSTTVTF